MTAAAVLLAGGAGTRFGSGNPKLLADLNGKPVVRWAVDSALASGLPLYVVTGAVDLAPVVSDATLVHNDRWADGLASSLRAGISAAAADGHDTVVVALADQPDISPEAWRAVTAEVTGTPIAVATYDGKRGHPVRLDREIWDELPHTGEDGARALMRERPELVTEVPCSSGSSLDVDTAKDLDRFNSPTRSA